MNWTVLASQSSSQTQQLEWYQVNSYKLSAGALLSYPGSIQTDSSGNEGLLNFDPLVIISLEKQLTQHFSLRPNLGITLPSSSRDGDDISIWSFYLNADLSYKLVDSFNLTYSLGWYFYRISGNGGTQELGNGSSKSEFFLPNGSTMSHNLVNNIGVEYALNSSWSLHLQSMIFNLLSDQDRNFSIILTVGKRFDI